MAKAKAPGKTGAKTNASNALKGNKDPNVAADNPSKFEATGEADLSAIALDEEDGLRKLLLDSVKDIYWAENHLVKTLPKLINAASLPSLKDALNNHLEETKGQVERLNEIFRLLGTDPEAKKCDGMEGLAKEGEGCIENTDSGTAARNLAIIMSAQKTEHYEIASYSGLVDLASNLGEQEIADLLSETLEEEYNADDTLSGIAETDIHGGEAGEEPA